MQDQVAKSQKLVGRVLGEKFRLTACIGIGGSGAVFKADQIALGRTVAVKILNEELSADARMVKRFRDEAMAASRLNHPNTVSIIDYGQAPDGLLYLAMEYVRGPTLTQLLVNESPLAFDRVLDIMAQALAGIEEAHLAGVVHADLKADNILLDQRRANVDVVKIVDFGIARLVTGPKDGDDRTICGTPEYMAPEVIGGAPPGFASDLYAVGIILYELLARETPFFAGSTMEILTNHLKAHAVPLSRKRQGAPAEIDEILGRALAKAPADRYGTAAEMREAIESARQKIRPSSASDRCGICGTQCLPRFKFCPECGTPRLVMAQTQEVTPPPAALVGGALRTLPFTGRDAALAQLVDHLRQPPRRGNGLLLTGLEGAGRTALLQQAYGQLGGDGGTIYQVGPDPSGLAAPFYPIRALLAAILGLPSLASLDELHVAILGLGLSDRDLPGIAQLFGHPTTLLELEPPIRRREMIFSALRAIERATTRGELAIVCEDVDRYDHPSLEILRRATESPDLLLPPIVLTVEANFAAQWPLVVPRLELGALETDELHTLVERLGKLGVRGLPPTQALFIATRAVPGHLDHVVRYLVEGGHPEDATGSLADLIAARLSLLARSTMSALQAAAVLGLEPERALLRAMLPDEAAGVDAALADATDHGLLLLGPSDDGALAFASRLVRDIVYDSTPADVRRSLHAAAADALMASADVARLGHHRDLAGQASAAIELLRQAGDAATEQLDDVGAGQFYQRALVAVRQAVQSGDDDGTAEGEFVRLSVKLADVLRARGETALARGSLAEARDWSGQAGLDAQIDRASASIAASEGERDAAVAALRRGIGRAIASGDMDLVCELYIELSTLLLRGGDPDGANRELVECIDLSTLGEGASAIGGPNALWRVIRAQAQIVSGLGDGVGALRLGEAALFHAQRVRSRLGLARVQQLLASLCEKEGLVGKAERYRHAAINEMRGLGDRRNTAELLLSDLPRGLVTGAAAATGAASATGAALADAAQLTREIGWAEGRERARRPSTAPPATAGGRDLQELGPSGRPGSGPGSRPGSGSGKPK